MDLTPVVCKLLRLFDAVGSPRTVKLITITLSPAKTIKVTFGPLNASDQLGCIQEIFFQAPLFCRPFMLCHILRFLPFFFS
jgi:hypothetical protein